MSSIILQPHVSEKSYKIASEDNVYVFNVPMSANKLTIAEAVERQFKVTVTEVRTLINKGKSKRTNRKRSQPKDGKRTNKKHAYVTLKEGDKIDIFESLGVEEE